MILTNSFVKTVYKSSEIDVYENAYRECLNVAYSLLYLNDINVEDSFGEESHFEFMSCYYPDQKLIKIGERYSFSFTEMLKN